MSVMVQLCSPASVLQPETSNIKKKAAKQQQSTSNNFAYALQDHRVGAIGPVVAVYPLYMFDIPTQAVQKKITNQPQIHPVITTKTVDFPSKSNDDFSLIELKSHFPSDLLENNNSKAISTEMNENNNCTLWPELLFSVKAIRFTMLVTNDIKDIEEFADSPILEFYRKNITGFAKDASFHIVLAVDLRGAPLARAIQSTRAAVDAASVAADVARRTANEYENKYDSPHKQLVRKAAQRAEEAASIARDIMKNVKVF
ncbi:uncharacterized protein LOC142330991 isoform X2 [Lycorma delicatula]